MRVPADSGPNYGDGQLRAQPVKATAPGPDVFAPELTAATSPAGQGACATPLAAARHRGARDAGGTSPYLLGAQIVEMSGKGRVRDE